MGASVETGIPRCTFLIGGMKCGSTSLFQALAQHPQVAPSRPKETNYLSMELAWSKGPQWFADRFQWDDHHETALDGSPSHSRVQQFPKAPERMACLDCEIQVVMLLRDPIRRIQSHVQHALAAPWGGRILGGDLEGVVMTSDYATQLEAYAEAIGRDRIHVLTLDEVKEDPQGQLAQIQRFLGLTATNLQMPQANAAQKEIWEARPFLRDAYQKKSHARRRALRACAYHARRTPGVRALFFRQRDDLPLPDGWEEDARRRLAPGMLRLRDEWGIDVSRWGFFQTESQSPSLTRPPRPQPRNAIEAPQMVREAKP